MNPPGSVIRLRVPINEACFRCPGWTSSSPFLDLLGSEPEGLAVEYVAAARSSTENELMVFAVVNMVISDYACANGVDPTVTLGVVAPVLGGALLPAAPGDQRGNYPPPEKNHRQVRVTATMTKLMATPCPLVTRSSIPTDPTKERQKADSRPDDPPRAAPGAEDDPADGQADDEWPQGLERTE